MKNTNAHTSANTNASLKITTQGQKIIIEAFGEWTKGSLGEIFENKNAIENLKEKSSDGKNDEKNDEKILELDFLQCSKMDFAGAVVVAELTQYLKSNFQNIVISNLKNDFEKLILLYNQNIPKEQNINKNYFFLEKIGKFIISHIEGIFGFLIFLGETFSHIIKAFIKPSSIRFIPLVRHIDHSGLRSLPIVGLTAFLVGLVTSYQASEQLARFGANIFIVEMSAISIFRELAPLIAAIVVAGRSASSYAAEIGAMKITEEIDAMKTMGFSPYDFLVLPRIFALFIAMPLVVFFADIVGVFGGMIVAKINLGMNFGEFISRGYSVVALKHIVIGLIKAPVYGIIIAIIGCYRGFLVNSSTQSIGNYTTISVVNAIFWVIAANAAISVLLTEIGI